MTLSPQPMDNAPRDGRAILTEVGIVRYMDQRRWGSPVPHDSWVACDYSGEPFENDEGFWEVEPKFWMDLPSFEEVD